MKLSRWMISSEKSLPTWNPANTMEVAAMAKEPVHIETKSVCPGIFNLLPGPTDEAIVTWSDGSQTTGVGYSKEEAIAKAISKRK